MIQSRMAAGPGFEPGQTDPESAVLPLHHPAKKCWKNVFQMAYSSLKKDFRQLLK